MKSRARKKQKIERRATLRASMKASKASLYTNTGAVQSDEVRFQRRRRPPLNKSDPSVLDLSGVTLDETSDSGDKSHMKMMTLDSHRPSTPASTLDYSSSGKMETSTYYDSDLGPVKHRQHSSGYYPPQLENEIAHYNPRTQQFQHVFQNNGFDEKSLDRSRTMPDSPTRGYSSSQGYGGHGGGPTGYGGGATGYGGGSTGYGGGATAHGRGSGLSGSGIDSSGYGGASGYGHSGPANTSSYSYGNPSFQGNRSGYSAGSGDRSRGGHSTSSSKIDWDELHPPRSRDERPPRPKPKESAM